MRNFIKAALVVSFLVPAISFAGDAPKAGRGLGCREDRREDRREDPREDRREDRCQDPREDRCEEAGREDRCEEAGREGRDAPGVQVINR